MSVPGVGGHETISRNEVIVVGRVGRAPVSRPLPSGDMLVAWRVIVDRGQPRQPGGKRIVDTLECMAFRPDVRQQAETWQMGDIVEVRGSIRRRFWRSASGPASRYEIEVTHGRRVATVAAKSCPASAATD